VAAQRALIVVRLHSHLATQFNPPRDKAVLAWLLLLVTLACCAAGLLVTPAITGPVILAVLAEGAAFALAEGWTCPGFPDAAYLLGLLLLTVIVCLASYSIGLR
jgi:hypothetical protein